ncbi:transposase [Nonomuraea marmarensis]
MAAEDLATLERITARCPELASVTELTRQFAEMLVHHRGEQDLEGWATRAETSPARELRDFVTGLRRDWAAVKAGLTLPYSSGAVEGNVNRIKMIKRIMYGRANADLLRISCPARLLITKSGPDPLLHGHGQAICRTTNAASSSYDGRRSGVFGTQRSSHRAGSPHASKIVSC